MFRYPSSILFTIAEFADIAKDTSQTMEMTMSNSQFLYYYFHKKSIYVGI